MSTRDTTPQRDVSVPDRAEAALRRIKNDARTRRSVEVVAERDDGIGALARIVLAVAHDEPPSPADCREAGIGVQGGQS